MSETNDRIESLEREVQRLRTSLLVLAVALVAMFALGATKGTPDVLKLRRLVIVDEAGKERISATAYPGVASALTLTDSNGKPRIALSTTPDGKATIGHIDENGKTRFSSSTDPNGVAGFSISDANEDMRISVSTSPGGTASILIIDSSGEVSWQRWSYK